MAKLLTAEGYGRKILDIYRELNVRPEEMLMLTLLNFRWVKSGERYEDLIKGLEWLMQVKYLEQKEGKKDVFFLTKVGFAAL